MEGRVFNRVSTKQKAMLISLYRRLIETGRRDTFVPTKGISSTTMKSLYKTGYIDTDRAIKDVPSNMRISDAGVEFMRDYFDTRKKSLDAILVRNKQFMRFVRDTEGKRLALLDYLQPFPLLIKGIEVCHKGYGVFEVTIPNLDEQYYGVYDRTEGNDIEVGGCAVKDVKNKRYYIEKMKLI